MFSFTRTANRTGYELKYVGQPIVTEKQAWEVTSGKWEILRHTCLDGKLVADGGVQTCGLCALYFYGHSDECQGCPIAKAGYPGCSNTPYQDYRLAVEAGKLEPALEATERELSFLNSLSRSI